MTRDRFEGCLLGLALGDALGAPLEGGPIERLLWLFIGKTPGGEMRWTDDTQMALDLAESLLARGALDPDDLARRLAQGYRWSRGYGPGAAKLLRRIARGAHWRDANRSVYAEGSFGNGAAVRAPVIGIFYAAEPERVAQAARESALVTHAHSLGVEGAVLIASAAANAVRSGDPSDTFGTAAAAACALAPFLDRMEVARAWLDSKARPAPAEVRERLGNGIAAAQSCVTALYLASRFARASFAQMQAFVAACGGDVDSIGAMAGALWGAANGASSLPQRELARLEQRERLVEVAGALARQ